MTPRRRAHRPLVLHDAERQARNEAWTKDTRARGDYHPPREDPFDMTTPPRPCVFCPDNWDNLDIVGEFKLEGDDYRIAIINPLDPVTDGHVLVICEGHSDSAATDSFIARSLMFVAALHVRKEGIQANIITSIGPDATQTVMHTHVHVVPRRPNDGLPLPWTPQHELKKLRAAETIQQMVQESGGDWATHGLFQQVPGERLDDKAAWTPGVGQDERYWPTALAERERPATGWLGDGGPLCGQARWDD